MHIIQSGGIKLERFLPKNQHTQRKSLNFENWNNGEPQSQYAEARWYPRKKVTRF